MFEFVQKHLRFLKKAPLLPHIFDSLLKLQLYFTGRHILKNIDQLSEEMANWQGITTHLHKYGGIQFDFNKSEIGHIHGNGLIDILLDKKTAHSLINEGKALPHHTFKNSGWISFDMRGISGYSNALYLFETSYIRKKRRLRS